MAIKRKKSKITSLAAGRPPSLQRPKSITRKATKALINSHHLLEKRKRQALSKGDETAAAAIDAEISALGGLDRYQQASLQGQRTDRGGDSSRVLLDWLAPVEAMLRGAAPAAGASLGRRLHMLEVGALSTANAGSRCFEIERIDLNSQAEGILQQDFMARPLPSSDGERFDIVSLSLVLNFVPEPQGRGEMLRRTLDFLHRPGSSPGPATAASPLMGQYFPSLFLVLPAPCVTNSRYLDETRLEGIMKALGYEKIRSKTTQRLVYYLWKRVAGHEGAQASFPKKELRPGGSRNNFAIVLKAPGG